MFSVDDMVFDQQGKSLKILTNNPTNDNVRFEISIPHEFLSGDMTTLLDEKLRSDIEQRNILGYSITVLSLPPGNHTVEIVGTSAIPEFQTITMVILAASIVPIILARNKLILR